MKLTRYQTDNRLWLRIALVLFLLSWWFPFFDIGPARPIGLLWYIVTSPVRSEFSIGELFGVVQLVFFSCVFGIPAIAAAWLIQCAVVIVKTKSRRSVEH